MTVRMSKYSPLSGIQSPGCVVGRQAPHAEFTTETLLLSSLEARGPKSRCHWVSFTESKSARGPSPAPGAMRIPGS